MTSPAKPSFNRLPKHVAVIMDGNGRWAEQRKLPRAAGHRAGVDVAQQLVKDCSALNIEYLTLFAFGKENWLRPEQEVSFLMELVLNTLKNQVQSLHEQNVRLKIIGDRIALNPELQQRILDAERLTGKNTGLTLLIALNYSGRWDVVQACRSIVKNVVDGKLSQDGIDESVFSQALSFPDYSDPDLLIRTSGEQRISNFMLWQMAYTELFFSPVLWPDFTREEFYEALAFYETRERRFGQVSSQIL